MGSRSYSLRDTWTDVEGRRVHAFFADPAQVIADQSPLVALLPGLGLPAYTFPTADALARRGITCAVLDLPGFERRSADIFEPDIHAVGHAAATWLLAQDPGRPTALLGHSTGAQAALIAAVDVQSARPELALVLAGPTFLPAQRRLPKLAAATLTAYRRDTMRELVVVPALARGRTAVVRLLRSGMRDAPERRIGDVRLPVMLTAGRADSFAPGSWLETLRAAAARSPSVDVRVLPGSHNNLYTQPERLADVVVGALSQAGATSGTAA